MPTLRFRLKKGDFEVELDGEFEYVKKEYERLLPDFLVAPTPVPAVPVTPAPPTEISIEQFPATAIGRTEYLVKIGFFDQQRALAEVRDELGRRGFPYNSQDVDAALRTLVQREILRRIGERGQYQYIKR